MYFKCVTIPESRFVGSVTFFGKQDFFFTSWIWFTALLKVSQLCCSGGAYVVK